MRCEKHEQERRQRIEKAYTQAAQAFEGMPIGEALDLICTLLVDVALQHKILCNDLVDNLAKHYNHRALSHANETQEQKTH